MALRIRKNGNIFCAALSKPKEGDVYINCGIHYMSSQIRKSIITQPMPLHKINGGKWKRTKTKTFKVNFYI